MSKAEDPEPQKSPKDRYSVAAKQEDKYWFCQCGLARKTAGVMYEHCKNTGHKAREIDAEEDIVYGVMAGGLEQDEAFFKRFAKLIGRWRGR